MNRWVWMAIVGFLFSPCVSAQLSRSYDPVVIPGIRLPAVKNSVPSDLRLFAYQAGAFKQIVFQIDERYEEMLFWEWTRRRREMVYALNLGEKVKADPNPLFDGDDELVFMARDLGAKAPAGSIPSGAEDCQEIKVTEPDSGNTGYAYLCKFKNPPPLLDQQYVSLSSSQQEISGKTYQIGYLTHPLFFDQLQLAGKGPLSPNLIDRFKINYECYGVYGAIVYQLNNTDIRTNLRGFKVGPVRVIKEVVSITEPWAHVQNRLLHHIYYYSSHLEWEMETRAPINWGPLNQFTYSLTLDLNPIVNGAKFLSEKNPIPVTVDGIYDEEELKLNYGPQEWMAVSTNYGTIYTHLALPLKAQELYPDLYYVDMAQKQDKPESYFGMFGKFGYKINNLQKTGRKPVIFRLNYFFSPEPYQVGSEKKLVGIYTQPLKVETDHSQGTAVAQSLPTPEERRKPSEQPIATMAPKLEVKQAARFISPAFILDPVNLGYGAGLGYSDEDFLKTGTGFGLSFLISTRNYYDLDLNFYKLTFIPFVEDFRVSFSLNQFPSESFYGLGNDSDLDHQVNYWWIRNEAVVNFRKHFAHHYGIDTQIFYRDTEIKSGQEPLEGRQKGKPSFEDHFGYWWELENGERWGGPLYGRDGGLTNGVNITFYRDMRDDWHVPHRGDFEAISIYRVGPEFLSDYNYTKVSIDLRKYFEPSWLQDLPMDHWFSDARTTWTKFFGPAKHRSICFRLGATHTFSEELKYHRQELLDIPFYELSSLGGSNDRGYYGNRFRDNDVFYLGAEYRWQYWRFFDAVIFVDSGLVMKDIFEQDSWDNEWHTSYGVGFRGHLPPGVIITFEYSLSPELPGGMITQASVF